MRDSSFELIRLVCQLYIVAYHILLFFYAGHDIDSHGFYRAMCIPLHISVPVFVMISGFFEIRLSTKGLLRIVGQMFVYGFLVALILKLLKVGGVTYSHFLFVARTPHWFMRSYICLYLCSPLINRVLMGINENQRIALLMILGWMSVYLGTFGWDASVSDGKNIVNFLFLYVVGNTIHNYEYKWRKWNWKILIAIYLVFNVLLFVGYIYSMRTILEKPFWEVSFPYCSPLLILNAVVFSCF